MKTPKPPKPLPGSLVVILFILLVLLVGLWAWQYYNVKSLGDKIEDFENQIDALPATVASKKQLEQQVTALEQQIKTLPATADSEEQLKLKKDRLTLEKDQINAYNATFGWLVQALGAAFFVFTAYFTYRNVRAIEPI